MNKQVIIAYLCLVLQPLWAQTNILDLKSIQYQIERILSTENHGHFHFHIHPILCQVTVENKDLVLYLEMETAEASSDLYDHFLESLQPIVEEHKLRYLKVYTKKQGEVVYQDLEQLQSSEPIPVYRTSKNTDPFPEVRGYLRRDIVPTPVNNGIGALTGKTVWLSPGHGWLYDDNLNTWRTQRGNTHDYVEDFGTVGGIDYFLQQYLINAGANVWLVRERDVNTNEVIVDNDAGAPTYTTVGNWTTSGSTGYNGGTYQFANASATETHEAIYTPTISESGWYWVSVFYREGTNRSVDVQYKVNHAGGQTVVSVNQEVHGLTWNYIGQFYFEAGIQGSVVLTNQSNDVGQAIIADAVRFGGGMGDSMDCSFSNTSGISGRPRFEECARQYAQWQGYPTCTGDVTIRPQYAEWELAKGAASEQGNAVYLSWHTNAFNGNARGTVTYTYNGMGAGGQAITPGSTDLAAFVQNELMNDIWGGWDATWQDRGTNSANFGELRELTTMPGCLVEVAFHDNIDDAAALQTPVFRNLVARAMYQGIVRFFNDRDGTPLDMLPEPPTHLFAKNTDVGAITLGWHPPQVDTSGVGGAAATEYKVYLSTHGKAFQDGVVVTDTSYTFTGLQAGTTYYFRVSASNAGGESFPTATVAARTPTTGYTASYLLVDGFDRLDRFGAVSQFESVALGNVNRMFLEQMNTFNYMVEHAQGFEYCGIAFDGASNEAVIDSMVLLGNYAGLDWITGEESTVDKTLDATEQVLLMDYLEAGGNLIISGAEIGWDIGRIHSGNNSTTFYNDYLKAIYVGDDGATYDFVGLGGTIFDNLNGSFDDGTNGYYDSEYPDRLLATGGAQVVLNYNGGTGDGAAVAYKGSDFGVVNFGFPLETVTDMALRDNLICEAITYLTPNICPFDVQLTTTYAAMDISTELVENNIVATSLIETEAQIAFDAGTQICLDAGFEVELGAVFEARIGGCSN